MYKAYSPPNGTLHTLKTLHAITYITFLKSYSTNQHIHYKSNFAPAARSHKLFKSILLVQHVGGAVETSVSKRFVMGDVGDESPGVAAVPIGRPNKLSNAYLPHPAAGCRGRGYRVAYWPTGLQILSSAAPQRNRTALSGVQSFQQISVINPSTITTPYILAFTSYITCSLFYYVSTHMFHIMFPPSSCNSLCHLCQVCLAVVLLLDHLVRLL